MQYRSIIFEDIERLKTREATVHAFQEINFLTCHQMNNKKKLTCKCILIQHKGEDEEEEEEEKDCYNL